MPLEPVTARWTLESELESLRAHPVARRRQAVEDYARGAAVELLIACLYDGDVDVTYDAAGVLARMATARAVDGLVELATGDNIAPARRVVAIGALGWLRRPPAKATATLRALAHDNDPWVANAATRAHVLARF